MVDTTDIEKKKADNTYKNNYWSPQLLYIEALYYVRQKNDSLAITGLTYIIQTYSTSPLKTKAQTMIEVLGKRKEIEEYLTKLQVTRATEEMVLVPAESNPITTQNVPTAPPIVKTQTSPTVKQPIVIKDSLKKLPVIKSASFKHIPTAPHVVLMLLDKVDGVYINEAKNAFDRYNRENFYGTKIDIAKATTENSKTIFGV